MTLEFLVLANVVLLARLFVLFKDDAAGGQIWILKTLGEIAAVLAFHGISRASLATAGALLIANIAGWIWEAKARRKNLGRLVLGLLTLAMLSVCASPASGLVFRPGLAEAAGRLLEWTAFAPAVAATGSRPVQLALLGLLLAANEANLLIRAVFDWLDLKPRVPPAEKGTVDLGEFNRGRIIGLLERALLYSFVLHAQFGAIGFILAAKAFARFKALENRSFAEYVLIGTLLSACLALAIGGAVRWLLQAH